jgi:hypothetical protein
MAPPPVIVLVVDSEAVPSHIADLLSQLVAEERWRVEVALSGGGPISDPRLLRTVQRIESRLMALSARPRIDSAPSSLGVTTPLASGAGIYINASESLSDAQLSSRVNAPVYSSTATKGGQLLGFSEVFDGARGSSFEVSVTAPGEPTRRLFSGRLQTQLFYLENRQSLAAHSNHYLIEALGGFRCENTVLPARPSERANFEGRLARYPARLIARVAGKALPRLVGRRLTWSVGARLENFTSQIQLRNPAGAFSADPFVIERDGEYYCFLEELSFGTGKGRIVCYRIRNGEFERIGIALEEPFHLSFPFLFEANGALFMCPESSANRDVRIYRCRQFPLEWSLDTIALRDISAVDTIVVRWSSRWWMITCVNPLGAGAQFSELCLFGATELAGPWIPHPSNPIRIDEVEVRNGGYYVDAGKSYRVNQMQGFGIYGEAIGINAIDHIDDREYRETPLPTRQPIAAPDIVGVHHLSRWGNMTVFDYSRNQR